MFEKEIEELFKLSMRVANETPAFVEFDVLSHVHICHINIMDAGWDCKAEYDGNYCIYFDGKCPEDSKKDYEVAKAHLLRLLANGKCPVSYTHLTLPTILRV